MAAKHQDNKTLTKNKAFIAVNKNTGFVDGACLTESPDSKQWCEKMKSDGFEIQIRDRSEAKEVLYTHVFRNGTLIA